MKEGGGGGKAFRFQWERKKITREKEKTQENSSLIGE